MQAEFEAQRTANGSVAVPGGLADAIDAILPQTQCTRCGYEACRPYAEAIARGEAGINRCPPGGESGIRALASLTGQPALPLDPECGAEGPRRVALVDEARCIGCTICIQKCPVDAIIGAPKQMHTVIAALCTGCDLCVPPCPVDCIDMVSAGEASAGWSDARRADARARFLRRNARLAREAASRLSRRAAGAVAQGAAPPSDRLAVIRGAVQRARARRELRAANASSQARAASTMHGGHQDTDR